MQEVEERFEKIKNHKPKASKKLNELGDILASAYKLEEDRADKMWQYIIELNVSDNVENAKFYIAQIFNKLIDRLKTEEATEFITMTPERVRLMVLYGYDGKTLWRCLDTLLKGYLIMDAVDNAAVCVEYFYEKFGGIYSNNNGIFEVARNAVKICIEMGEDSASAEELLFQIGNSENNQINIFVDLIKAVNGIGEVENFEELFRSAKEHKCPEEFYELLWIARNKYNYDELREKWIDYVKNCGESDKYPYSYMYEDECDYNISRLKFYVDLEKEADELLLCYFNRANIYDVEKGILWTWIEDENWDFFIKYVSLTIMATPKESFEYSAIKRTLNEFTDGGLEKGGFEHTDRYGRSYSKLLKPKLKIFAESLAKISAVTIGCASHDNYHEFVKDFVQKSEGNLDVINKLGFEEIVETRTAEERLKDYVKEFFDSGENIHEKRTTKYELIKKALYEEAMETNHAITIDITAALTRALGEKIEDAKEINDSPKIDKLLEQTYRLANDNDIAKFYFQYCPQEYQKRAEMLIACIKKSDISLAIELIDMMIKTKENPDYEKQNGWSWLNMLTLKQLIWTFDCTSTDRWEYKNITDDMRQIAKQLIYRMMPYLSLGAAEELKGEIYRIDPELDDSEEYIAQLLDDMEVYTMFPKPRGKGSTSNINRMTNKFMHCFERLSQMGRIDIIARIMTKFAEVKDVLKPVTFDRWMSFMAHGLAEKDLAKIYCDYPGIFESWLEMDSLTESSIRNVASNFGSGCTREEFISFRNMIIMHKGMVVGIDDSFKATSENTKTQTLFDGENAKIELDYMEISRNNLISAVRFHLLTTKKTRALKSVRIASCTINSIKMNDLNPYSEFDDKGPRYGYCVYKKDNEDTVIIYSDFFKENNINAIETIELQLMLSDEVGKTIENMTSIVIKHDYNSGEYKVIKMAESQGSIVMVDKYDENIDEQSANVINSMDELLKNYMR